MAPWHYDRLSAQDNSFLLWERGNVRMHVASTNICDMGPLRTPSGGIDIELVKRATMGIIHLVPRYRQRLFEIPVFSHAVWVDDIHFDIDYHIRHTALPKPGTLAQLKNLVARVLAQPLDRKRPLWEYWFVEGLAGGDQFAMITKIHHCMIDGSSGVDLANIQFSTSPEPGELGAHHAIEILGDDLAIERLDLEVELVLHHHEVELRLLGLPRGHLLARDEVNALG